ARGSEADEGIRPKGIVILRDGAPRRIEHLQARVQRRAEASGLDLTANRLPLACGERPDVHVFMREDAAVDRDRERYLDRDRVAGQLLLDDLRQVADDEASRRRGALRCPDTPVPRAERGIGGNLHLTGHILRVVFLALRIGKRQQWTFQPERVRAPQLLAGIDAGAQQLESALIVEEKPADADIDGLPALSA